MPNSINTFTIKLDNPTATYAPGSLITGQVILELDKQKSFRALKLRFEGIGKVQWSGKPTGDGKQKNTQTYGHMEKEEYFRTDICLYKGIDGNSTELLAGYYAFAFNFLLPINIPSSFEHTYGFVRYTMKAIIDRPWRFDHETKIVFTVETPLVLEPSYALLGIDDEVNKSHCSVLIPCINQGNIILRLQLPRIGYICGDYVEPMVDIDNQYNSIVVTKIRLALEQTLLFHSVKADRQKNVTKIIEKSDHIGPFSGNIKEVVRLRIPLVPLSYLQYCNLVEIEYRVLIKVYYSGCHCSTQRSYDMLIGSAPTINSPEQQMTTTIADHAYSNVPSVSIDHSN